MNIERSILIIFGIGVFGAIFFMIVAAWIHNRPSRKLKLSSLLDKQNKIQDQLVEISIRQVHCLNTMLSCGSISPLNYDLELLKIINSFKENELDTLIITTIPRPSPPHLEDILNRTMIISNELNSSGHLSDEELNENINKALDGLNNIRS